MKGFVEVGDRVYLLRYPVLDVNVTLVVGDGAAVVVDTLSTAGQAAELRDAIRHVTSAPLTLINTHHHYDHVFGNGTLAGPGTAIWSHQEAAATLRLRLPELKQRWYGQLVDHDEAFAEQVRDTDPLLPDHTFHLESTVEAGGRTLLLRHPGRGHTAGDLVAYVPDADVLLAGDLVEQSGPPGFDDSYPLDWPDTLAAVLPTIGPGTVVVPGHGAPVDAAFVRQQHDQLTALAWLIREGHADRARPAELAAAAPFDAESSLTAIQRGYADLDGRL